MIRKIEIERFSLTPLNRSIRLWQLLTNIGHPDMAEFARSTHEARSFAELEARSQERLERGWTDVDRRALGYARSDSTSRSMEK